MPRRTLPVAAPAPILAVQLLAVLVLAALLAACVGPSRTDEDFRRKAAHTAESMAGVVETARLIATTAGRDRMLAPYAAVALRDAEDDATSIAATFGSVQPPSAAADELRAGLDDVLQQATSGIADLRIAARRGQLGRLPSLARPLAEVSDQLRGYAEVDR